MKATTAWILALMLPVAAEAAPATGNPVVYHSPDGQGTRPATSPYPIPAADNRPLYLYIDFDNSPDIGASSGAGIMCVSKNGDETCAFDVSIEMVTNAATFDTFVPAGPGIVGLIEPVLRKSLRVNGINVNGMLIPAAIGTLTVDAFGANQLQIKVIGVHRVGAAGQLDAIQGPQVIVPEPTRVALLCSGIAALTALHRVRRHSRRKTT